MILIAGWIADASLSRPQIRRSAAELAGGEHRIHADGLCMASQYSTGWRNQHLEGRTFRTTQQVGALHHRSSSGHRVDCLRPIRSSGRQLHDRTLMEISCQAATGQMAPNGTSRCTVKRRIFREPWSTIWTTRPIPSPLPWRAEGESTLGGIEVHTRSAVRMADSAHDGCIIISLFFGLRSIAMLVAVRSVTCAASRGCRWISPLPPLRAFSPRRRLLPTRSCRSGQSRVHFAGVRQDKAFQNGGALHVARSIKMPGFPLLLPPGIPDEPVSDVAPFEDETQADVRRHRRPPIQGVSELGPPTHSAGECCSLGRSSRLRSQPSSCILRVQAARRPGRGLASDSRRELVVRDCCPARLLLHLRHSARSGGSRCCGRPG